MGDEPFMQCSWNRIDLSGSHWLVEQCCASGGDPETLAWLLLAIYAELNARMPTFTDDHERQFVQVLMGALEAGDLKPRVADESMAS